MEREITSIIHTSDCGELCGDRCPQRYKNKCPFGWPAVYGAGHFKRLVGCLAAEQRSPWIAVEDELPRVTSLHVVWHKGDGYDYENGHWSATSGKSFELFDWDRGAFINEDAEIIEGIMFWKEEDGWPEAPPVSDD